MVCEYDPAVRDYCLERILNTSRSRDISLKLSGGHIVVICLINLACREIGCFGDDKPGSNDEQNTKSGEYKIYASRDLKTWTQIGMQCFLYVKRVRYLTLRRKRIQQNESDRPFQSDYRRVSNWPQQESCCCARPLCADNSVAQRSVLHNLYKYLSQKG